MSVNWRISPLSPVRDLGRMDYERCGALHNEIVERGWNGAGNAPESLDRTTYWDRWHDDPSWPPQGVNLDPSIVDFYKIAIDSRNGKSFFWSVFGFYGAGYPSAPNNEISGDKDQYLLLHATNLITGVSHPAGIVLDQHTFKAIFQPSIWDTETVMFNGIEWQPLEVILDGFLDMIDQGKVVAFAPEDRRLLELEEGREEREGVDPWVMEPFSETDLRDALFQFERLIEAIEARMPALSPDVPIRYGFFDPDEADDFRMFPKHGFARRFFSAARRPRFQFIAPGLWCVGTNMQPFSDLHPKLDTDARLRPVLFARGEESPAEGTYLRIKEVFEDADDIPCGLYLTELLPDHPFPWEDGCRLVLPYMIGDKGHARRSDGTFFATKFTHPALPREPLASSTEVFQHGQNPFLMGHDVQLKRVLQRWAELVESGYWEVDANGVAGGIEKWREVDTAEHWHRYQLPVHW